jgi:LmbE family N-acetylglucosaminyl deacetylase
VEEGEQMSQLRLLACFAHPDDEAFTAAGVLCGHPPTPVGVTLSADLFTGVDAGD